MDEVSCAKKAQLQCLPMPETATSAGECPSGHGMGTRWLQQSPLSANCPQLEAHGGSCPALLQHLLLRDAQGCSGNGDSRVRVWPWVCRVVTLEKPKPRQGSLCGAQTWTVLFISSPHSVLLSSQAQG